MNEEHTYCNKHPYPTAAMAAKAMHRAVKKGGKKRGCKGVKVAPYKCTHCGEYHWGYYGTKTTPKRKTRRVKSD